MTKADLKYGDSDTLEIAKWVDLASLKSEINKLDINKFETTPTDLSKLSNLVKNEVAKKNCIDKLVKKVNVIQTSDYKTKVAEIEKKPRVHDLNNRYITTQEFNKLTTKDLAARLKPAHLAA